MLKERSLISEELNTDGLLDIFLIDWRVFVNKMSAEIIITIFVLVILLLRISIHYFINIILFSYIVFFNLQSINNIIIIIFHTFLAFLAN